METKSNVTQSNVTHPAEFIIPKETSWHFERKLKPNDKRIDNYVLIEPGAPDVVKVLQAYTHHPVSAYNIASIEIVYNADLNQQFFNNMKVMNKRKGNPKYVSKWRTTTGIEKAWREATYCKLQDLSASHADPSLPNLMLLPLWHGTSDTVSGYILEGGYGIFSSDDPNVVTDEGYFGKGIYTAHEAEYAFRSYAQRHGVNAVLLLNWVSIYEAYPVIDGDMAKLKGRMGGYDQCDAHFIPVVPYDPDNPKHTNPSKDSYYPTRPNEDHTYTELVVFSYQQCLPRYRVKLIKNSPQLLLDDAASLCYQNALGSLKLSQYGEVAKAWKDAADAGHPGAAVRLHWWYSGASGVYSANQALSKVQVVQTSSVNALKQKANFRGDNDPESQFTLAWCYQHGLGCEVNLAKAAQYYWIAAEQGHREAQYQLGVCGASGIGVKPDMNQAIIWYERAAKLGHIHAHYILSQCYELGLGTKLNPAKALEHKQAAQKGKHPQLMGTGLLPTAPVAISPNVQLEQEVKQLKQQLAQQAAILKEKELQITEQTSILKQKELDLTQQLSTLKQKELELTQEKLKLKQQQDKAVQDQRKIKELTQAISIEQQASRSKDELMVKQKEEQKKKDEIIVKQNQEKTEAIAKIEMLQQQTQKAADLSKELQLTQQKLNQKDEALNIQWFEMQQLKTNLTEAKEREADLKREFEAYKKLPQSPTPKPQTQVNSSPFFSSASKSDPVLNPQQQKKQDQLVAACLKGDLALVIQLQSQEASFSYPSRKGQYPLVAAVYGCSLETVRYVEAKLKNEAEKQWSQVDVNKAKTELDRWTPTELSTNATFGELGKWYKQYEGANWCAYYDTECLKREDCKNWGGWDDTYKNVVWRIGGKQQWGEGSARTSYHIMRNAQKDYTLHKFNYVQDGAFKGAYMLSPSIKVHDDVVKAIREQLNQLRSQVESKVKRSSAPVFDPMVSVPIQKEQFSGNYSSVLSQSEPKMEFEAYKTKTQSPAPKPQPQANLDWSTFFSSGFFDVMPKPALLNSQQQGNQLVAACLKGDLTLVKQLELQGTSFFYPNQEGLYPLVAAVYGCNLEMVRYVESKLKNEAEKQWSQVDVNKAKTELDRWTPTELSTNATFGELGKWYVKYQGASWCMYYDTECLKRESCQRWGGWEPSTKWDTWDLGGNKLWGAESIRVKIMIGSGVNLQTRQLSKHMKSTTGDYIWPVGDNEILLTSPTVKVHDDVVKIIREQMNQLRSKVETKVKRSSAAVFNPKV